MLSVSIIMRVLRRFGGASPSPGTQGFLLLEDGARLLLETGENILLERASPVVQPLFLLCEDGERLILETGESILLEH